MADHTDFMAQAKAQMDSWTVEMQKLQANMIEAGQLGQAQMQKNLEHLLEQRDQMQKHVEELQKANIDAMRDVQAKMESAFKEIEEAMAEARKKFMG